MPSITLECHAKINVGLFIKGKLADGYHQLETLFVPLHSFHDLLSIEKVSSAYPSQFDFGGKHIPCHQQDNLVCQAYQLMKTRYPKVGNVRISLTKQIPIGAGLGGGSSNAAKTLQALNELFRLGLTMAELSELAKELGSDVPFFLHDEPMLGTGTGNVLTSMKFPKPKEIRIASSQLHIETAAAYKMINLADCHTDTALKPLLEASPDTWRKTVHNDFEKPIFDKHPALQEAKEALYAQGATYASLSGSGSTVYGLFY